MKLDNLEKNIAAIPPGYSEVEFQGKKYGLSRTDFTGGKSTKIYAQELSGSDYISFNYYRTQKGGLLKTCEMPEEKVLTFLKEIVIYQPSD